MIVNPRATSVMWTPNQVRNWLSDQPHHIRGIRILQCCIGMVLLFRVGTEGPFAQYLWGPSGIGQGNSMTYLFGHPVGTLLDQLFTTQLGTWSVLLVMAIGAMGLVFGYRTRLATFLALFGLFMIEQRLPEIGDGGDNIARLVLIYMLFLVPAGRVAQRGSLTTWVHNVAVAAIMGQLIVLYATSGLMKTYGEKWHHGTAMYYISQVEWVSLPIVRDLFKNPFVTTVASYIPMLFMVLFPMAIFSRFKLLWIAIGVGLHLGIGTVMGLVTFSTVMIGMELFLITDAEYDRILRILSHWWTQMRKLGRRLGHSKSVAVLDRQTHKDSALRPSGPSAPLPVQIGNDADT